MVAGDGVEGAGADDDDDDDSWDGADEDVGVQSAKEASSLKDEQLDDDWCECDLHKSNRQESVTRQDSGVSCGKQLSRLSSSSCITVSAHSSRSQSSSGVSTIEQRFHGQFGKHFAHEPNLTLT